MSTIDPSARINDNTNTGSSLGLPDNFNFDQAIRGAEVEEIARAQKARSNITAAQRTQIATRAGNALNSVIERVLSTDDAYATLNNYINNTFKTPAARNEARRLMRDSVVAVARRRLDENGKERAVDSMKSDNIVSPIIQADIIKEVNSIRTARDALVGTLNKNWKI